MSWASNWHTMAQNSFEGNLLRPQFFGILKIQCQLYFQLTLDQILNLHNCPLIAPKKTRGSELGLGLQLAHDGTEFCSREPFKRP